MSYLVDIIIEPLLLHYIILNSNDKNLKNQNHQ